MALAEILAALRELEEPELTQLAREVDHELIRRVLTRRAEDSARELAAFEGEAAGA